MKEKISNGLIRVLFLEDDTTYCHDLKKELLKYPELFAVMEIIQASFVEEAFSILKKNRFDAIIIDLGIYHCCDVMLAQLEEEHLNLKSYTPPEFLGIALVLHMQRHQEYVKSIPKLVMTGHHFDLYKEYYSKMSGSKSFYMKQPNQEENMDTIIQWLKKIVKSCKKTHSF